MALRIYLLGVLVASVFNQLTTVTSEMSTNYVVRTTPLTPKNDDESKEDNDERNAREVIEVRLDDFITMHQEQRNSTEVEWRKNLTTLERYRHILQGHLFADCSLVVGPDDNQTEIDAHRVILQSSSPVLEKVFDSKICGKKIKIRLQNVSAEAMLVALDFMYTGRICLENFDIACELVDLASRLQVDALSHTCNDYIFNKIYPDNVWRAYMCGHAANDTELKEAALFIAKMKTDAALLDPKFSEIPQDVLVDFLSESNLNLSSEVKLYEAALRWAMAETQRRNLPPGPQSMREVLGQAIKHIRFLLFTPNEFANIQSTTQVLSYSESLAIIFNLNSPGVVSLPEGFTMNKARRNASSLIFAGITAKRNVRANTCITKSDQTSSLSNFVREDYVQIINLRGESYFGSDQISGIQIPIKKPLPNHNCSDNEPEFLTVTLYRTYVDSPYVHNTDEELASVHYLQTVNTCAWKDFVNGQRPPQSLLYNILFKNKVYVYNLSSIKFKIKFNLPGIYADTLRYHSDKFANFYNAYGNYQTITSNGKNYHVYTHGSNEFIYSFLT